MRDIFCTVSLILFFTYLKAADYNSLAFVENPKLVDQTNTSLTVQWQTNISSMGYYKMIAYPNNLHDAVPMIKITEDYQSKHKYTIRDIESDRFYYFQAINIIGGDTIASEVQMFSPASESSGEIEIYFNNEVKHDVSRGHSPNGTTAEALETAILEKINAAKTSIDYCIYNTHRASIVDALTDAANRGVRIRAIYNEREESTNYALDSTLPFETVERLGDGLMHNKFLIIDASSVDEAWIMSGSTNFTNNQMDRDPNHIVFIQDQNLAKAYEIEFEEMWGSDNATPDASKAKFGIAKSDNTPHEFIVGGRKIELYFSPSDNVSTKINDAISSAEIKIDAALLIFTKWETRDAIVDELNTGTRLRGIIEDEENSSDVINRLNGAGADIVAHSIPGQFHHKYAIIDEVSQDEGSKVITGSHNWSHSADIRHDENLLIIHDPNVANIFQQEFEARWLELRTSSIANEPVKKLKLYPIPAQDYITMDMDNEVNQYKIFDIRGALVMEGQLLPGKREQLLKISHLNSGTYFIVANSTSTEIFTAKFVKLNTN